MKFDKETTIALIICLSLIILWGFYFKRAEEKRLKRLKENQHLKIEETKNEKEYKERISEKINTQGSVSEKVLKGEETLTIKPQKDSEEKIFFIQDEYAKFAISSNLSSIKSVEFFKFKNAEKTQNLKFGSDDIPLGALRVSIPSAKSDDLSNQTFLYDESTKEIILSRKFFIQENEIELKQSFRLSKKNPYIVESELQIYNPAPKEIVIPDLSISAGSISDFKSIAGDKVQNEYISIDACTEPSGAVRSRPHKGKNFSDREDTPIRWLALSNKYFSSILKGSMPFSEGNTMIAFTKLYNKHEIRIIGGEAVTKVKIPPEQTIKIPLSLYIGPKERSRLKEFDAGAVKIMHLGWNWIEPLSQLLLTILVWMSRHFGSYGWSIIILTFLVKLIFWPITEKANTSMKKMQKIQPLLLEIREKYKNDPQKMNAKTLQVYKEHGVNPFGGCFPILLQIPVFLALYNTLNGAVELRQASFLWAKDLSRPDTIFIVPGIMLPINPLVIAMAVTMFIQQKLTPSVADQTQQMIMMMMPFIMLVMLYSLPSGLTLYWTVSQILSIIQLLINKYRDTETELKTKA